MGQFIFIPPHPFSPHPFPPPGPPHAPALHPHPHFPLAFLACNLECCPVCRAAAVIATDKENLVERVKEITGLPLYLACFHIIPTARKLAPLQANCMIWYSNQCSWHDPQKPMLMPTHILSASMLCQQADNSCYIYLCPSLSHIFVSLLQNYKR